MWSTVKTRALGTFSSFSAFNTFNTFSILNISFFILFFAGLLTSGAQAQGIHATYMRLDNGLRVIIYPNPTAPIVSCRLFYVTGSVHEAPGHTGIAHMLEH